MAWFGEKEAMILNDIESDAQAIVLRIVPLSPNSSKIEKGILFL